MVGMNLPHHDADRRHAYKFFPAAANTQSRAARPVFDTRHGAKERKNALRVGGQRLGQIQKTDIGFKTFGFQSIEPLQHFFADIPPVFPACGRADEMRGGKSFHGIEYRP